jgi:hypothetical protein
MRSAVVAILFALAACHGSKQSGPAWPAPSTTGDDGGESIAPRETTVAAAVEKSADAKDDDEKPAAEAAKPADASEEKPAETAPQTPITPVDDVIITDDIVIEIEDD